MDEQVYKKLFRDSNTEEKNYKKFYKITITVLAIIYTFWFWQLNFCVINAYVLYSLIIAIPLVLIWIMYILTEKEKIKVKIGKIISIILILVFLALKFFIVIFVMVEEGVSYENNPLRYKHIYNIADYSKIRFHFPKEIPQDLLNSSKAKFYYRPQFLQAPFCFELLLEMNNDEIDEYIEKYKEQAKEIIEVNEENYNNLSGKYGIHGPHDIFEYKEIKKFFVGSKVYLFGSESYKPDDWNHGYVYYMAKNENFKKLLLVTEVW